MIPSPMLSVFLAVFLLSSQAHGADGAPPYSGQESRQIKALSPQEIDDLKAGNGSGMALAAELNGYPGPRHVRDLGPRLGLSPVQQAKVDRLARDMESEAVALGHRVIGLERDLDRLFSGGRVDEAAVVEAVTQISALKGQLRLTHLRYHLRTKALMTLQQVARYDAMRGYSGRSHGGMSGTHGHH